MTDFLNVPSFNVGNGPVSFGNFTRAPGPPNAALGSTSLGATSIKNAATSLTTQEKMVFGMGILLTVGGAYGAYASKKNRRSMSAIAMSGIPLAMLFAGMN
tara:strand:- start:585 stop:887 length:303 start_codon:yes stop_codon:yes gene_type:complete